MSADIPLTMTDLLKFNPRWDSRDRAVIAEDVQTLKGVNFRRSTSGYPSIDVSNADDVWVLSVAKGTIYYSAEFTRPGSVHLPSHGAHVFRLSTSRENAGTSPKAEVSYGGLCEACYLHHPEGECDR